MQCLLAPWNLDSGFVFLIYFYLFIHSAVLGLFCSTPTLSCGMWDPATRSGVIPHPSLWKHEVLTTGPLGKSKHTVLASQTTLKQPPLTSWASSLVVLPLTRSLHLRKTHIVGHGFHLQPVLLWHLRLILFVCKEQAHVQLKQKENAAKECRALLWNARVGAIARPHSFIH